MQTNSWSSAMTLFCIFTIEVRKKDLPSVDLSISQNECPRKQGEFLFQIRLIESQQSSFRSNARGTCVRALLISNE